ncbi:MAG: hypothetical protein HQL84_16930 [Magnetococcales bacterium]|nr:hypothetical protein [Magnetococcales bacterium]MBF0151706.1 hypothetical protein [Magnetococcales bacterium]MBF0174126.1 hypothetical protein [Magnetococcales bacterium]MBF0346975.1 hypothetical protein [Magnetococcales bacterium]MBF0631076.1 hypothetical protein [Magnetococcales bacterium]
MNNALVNIIRGQLTRDRFLSARNAGAIATHLNVEDPLLGLKPGVLKHREEFEVDLLVSPLFTPSMEDRAECEPSLPLEGISSAMEREIIAQLAPQELQCKVIFGDGSVMMTLPEVAIERHVHLLRLTVAVSAEVKDRLGRLLTGQDLSLGMSYARSQIWIQIPNLLEPCLTSMTEKKDFTLEKFGFLRDFVRTYHPKDMASLVQSLKNLVESYRIGNDRPVFNQQLEDHQATAIRSAHCNEDIEKYRVQMANALLADFR